MCRCRSESWYCTFVVTISSNAFGFVSSVQTVLMTFCGCPCVSMNVQRVGRTSRAVVRGCFVKWYQINIPFNRYCILRCTAYEVRPESKFRFLFLSRPRAGIVIVHCQRLFRRLVGKTIKPFSDQSVECSKRTNKSKIPSHVRVTVREIRFLNVRNAESADVRRRICEVYGENASSDSTVKRRGAT